MTDSNHAHRTRSNAPWRTTVSTPDPSREWQRGTDADVASGCVCGCAQDAATIAHLTETLRLRTEALARVTARAEKAEAVIRAAALETYTPDGSERFVTAFHEVLGRATAAEAKVARVEALAEKWQHDAKFHYDLKVEAEALRRALDGPDV